MNNPAYVRRFNRISLLPVSFFCPAAARISEQHGAGREALTSQAFHAKMAGSPDASRLLSLLTDDEREAIESWDPPKTIDFGDFQLDYGSAEKEVPVALTRYGAFTEPGSPDAVTQGTLDFAWVREWHGQRVAFVGDIKKRSTPHGPESLQLKAYALAYAEKVQADAYATGLWIAEEQSWQWQDGPPISLTSERAAEDLRRVVTAATNTEGSAVTGTHCLSCFGSPYCPEWTLPAAHADTWLEPVTKPGGITPDNALDLLLKVKAIEDVLPLVKAQLKAHAQREGIRDGNGKVWKPRMQRGKESISVKDARAVLGEQAEKAIKRGSPFEVYGWVKE